MDINSLHVHYSIKDLKYRSSQSLVQRLRLPRSSVSVTITGIGARSVVTSCGRVAIDLSSLSDSNVKVKFEALVLPRLTSYTPPEHLTVSRWPHLAGLVLADPEFSSPFRIEILLGADFSLDLFYLNAIEVRRTLQ